MLIQPGQESLSPEGEGEGITPLAPAQSHDIQYRYG